MYSADGWLLHWNFNWRPIVGAVISPTGDHLIELVAIALIRTFLNYFLNRELSEQQELSRTKIGW
jgi:uncharacterized membrane protein